MTAVAFPSMPKNETISRAQTNKQTLAAVIRTPRAATESHTVRVTRSGFSAPRFWPTSVRTELCRPKLGIRAIIVTRLPMLQAARALAPNGESIRTMSKRALRSSRFCAMAGQARRVTRDISALRGRKSAHRSVSLDFPFTMKASIVRKPPSLPTPIPKKLPARPKAGTGPQPNMRSGMKMSVKTVEETTPAMVMAGSPVPLKICPTTNMASAASSTVKPARM